MPSSFLVQERLRLASRLLFEIQHRHGLLGTHQLDVIPHTIDRFLVAYLPETREGQPAPRALEYAFAPTLSDALQLLRSVVSESVTGWGAAIYVHDLDTGVAAGAEDAEGAAAAGAETA